MNKIKCLYCGEQIADDVARCPQCGAISHFQKRGYRAGARRKFLIFFIAVTLFSLFMAFWLPR